MWNIGTYYAESFIAVSQCLVKKEKKRGGEKKNDKERQTIKYIMRTYTWWCNDVIWEKERKNERKKGKKRKRGGGESIEGKQWWRAGTSLIDGANTGYRKLARCLLFSAGAQLVTFVRESRGVEGWIIESVSRETANQRKGWDIGPLWKTGLRNRARIRLENSRALIIVRD